MEPTSARPTGHSVVEREAMRSVVRRVAVTFEKRDWGSGRETWRERPEHHARRGPCHYALRRLSNKEAKRRELSGELRPY